jgi:2-polyprenyl-3-methyl-5-hydroxy-6-metoxy-1,4-benzoquinol methylase
MTSKKNISIGDFEDLVPNFVLGALLPNERLWLQKIFEDNQHQYPTLRQIWQLMDEQWIAHECDPFKVNENLTNFYNHPVWLLNGLFIEQDAESLAHRLIFSKWAARNAPSRIADFGGGFGSLARLIGQALPNAKVEIVEPHPSAVAVLLSSSTSNVRFVSKLTGEYDLLIATDVFEHVPDPLGLCFETAAHLRVDGEYLIANCFSPIIKCHLPQLFYLEYGWDSVMHAMGLVPGERVGYGRAYQRTDILNLAAARNVGERARRLYPLISLLPKGRAWIGALVMRILGDKS